jgi:hypothetical protein
VQRLGGEAQQLRSQCGVTETELASLRARLQVVLRKRGPP